MCCILCELCTMFLSNLSNVSLLSSHHLPTFPRVPCQSRGSSSGRSLPSHFRVSAPCRRCSCGISTATPEPDDITTSTPLPKSARGNRLAEPARATPTKTRWATNQIPEPVTVDQSETYNHASVNFFKSFLLLTFYTLYILINRNRDVHLMC